LVPGYPPGSAAGAGCIPRRSTKSGHSGFPSYSDPRRGRIIAIEVATLEPIPSRFSRGYKTPRYGTSIVYKKNSQLFGDCTFLAHEVREIADLLRDEGKLSAQAFSLDMCRHGGMTELQESGLTEGQGRALSKHKTAAAYRGYAKETEKRVLEATKKRFGHSEQPKIMNENNVSKKEKKA
jgi:hypothetical protein